MATEEEEELEDEGVLEEKEEEELEDEGVLEEKEEEELEDEDVLEEKETEVEDVELNSGGKNPKILFTGESLSESAMALTIPEKKKKPTITTTVASDPCLTTGSFVNVGEVISCRITRKIK